MKNNHTRYISLMLIQLLSVCFTTSRAQGKIEFTYKSFGLEAENENVIQNAGHLDDFFEDLYNQKMLNDRKINIVHIGDSHIQADYLTTVIRRNFQKDFGNAGRGFVFPLRVAGTNEPYNVKSNSTVKWETKRCVYPDQPLPIGVGGVTIRTDQPNTKLTVFVNDLWVDYMFNTLTLFFKKDSQSFDFILRDTANNELSRINAQTDPFVNYSTVKFVKPVGAVTVELVQSNIQQTQATIFGFNLENDQNGILYHAIGVNGAKYEHYNAAQYFSSQTSALQPEVFIISLGTNEALNYPYLDRDFYNEIDRLVTSLRDNNPHAKFILVTPPDAFMKRVKINPGILKIRDIIIQYAVDNGLAFYDMYKALGAKAALWRKAGLLRPDGIHFTKEGYEYQGTLIYAAFMKSYNQYVPLRHP